MSEKNSTRFEQQLGKFDENDWQNVIERLASSIHEVDRTATRIWFRFYPLSLFRYLEKAEDLKSTLNGFAIQGEYELKTQVDSSHDFLYGHRFWPNVKHAIIERAGSFDGETLDLEAEVRQLAKSVASEIGKKDDSLVIGIVLVGLMTLVQTGFHAFSSEKADSAKPGGLLSKSPEAVVAARAKEKKQGVFSFLKTIDKEFEVNWDETKTRAKFDVMFDEEIASGAARDQSQNWAEKDERCIEGVIPVECRSAACGTCWVGVVGGADRLSDVQRLERKQIKVFGYYQGEEQKPYMRLACQARAEGSVSVVIPPWNGVFGKKVYGNIEKIELEPATTSAVKLRETISDVLKTSEQGKKKNPDLNDDASAA